VGRVLGRIPLVAISPFQAGEMALSAEAAYEDCREILEAHERSHGCAGKTIGKTATDIVQ
jgi:hypothetical protein